MLRIKIEKWSPAAETRAVRETGDATAGAPYQVDHGDGSFDAEVAGCWRLETPTEP